MHFSCIYYLTLLPSNVMIRLNGLVRNNRNAETALPVFIWRSNLQFYYTLLQLKLQYAIVVCF